MKLYRLLLLIFLLLFPLGSAASQHKNKNKEAAPPPSGAYIGFDSCITCHDEPGKSLEPTAHQKLFADKEPARNGCEACHGPGSEHVNRNGDPEKIFRFAAASGDEVRTRCGACHTDFSVDHGHQKVSCLGCHSVHHASERKGILLKAVPELCSVCHR